MNKILITGGAGFIGSHLCDALINDNEIFCLDNLFTGSKQNIAHLLNHPHFNFILADVTLPVYYEVDEIYHLACPASPIHYQRNPVKTIEANVIGTFNMLRLARDVKAKILLASTSEVYGDPLEHPQKEDYFGNVNPVGPRSCYDEGKRCAEALMTDFAKQYGIDIRIARIFNTYGPKMAVNDGRVVSTFIVNALRGEPLVLNGGGKITRSFMYITDLIDGLIKLMNGSYDRPVNLGNPNELTIFELAEIILDMTQSRSELVPNGGIKDDPQRRRPDITLAKSMINWQPKIRLLEGLQETVKYFAAKS